MRVGKSGAIVRPKGVPRMLRQATAPASMIPARMQQAPAPRQRAPPGAAARRRTPARGAPPLLAQPKGAAALPALARRKQGAQSRSAGRAQSTPRERLTQQLAA